MNYSLLSSPVVRNFWPIFKFAPEGLKFYLPFFFSGYSLPNDSVPVHFCDELVCVYFLLRITFSPAALLGAPAR